MKTAKQEDLFTPFEKKRRRCPVREISSHLSAAAGCLESIYQRVEPRFMKLGEDFQSLFMDAEQLVQLTLQAVKLMDEESEEGVLAAVTKIGDRALTEIQTYQAMETDRLGHLAVFGESFSSLMGMCEGLEEIALSLNVVGLDLAEERANSESKELLTVLLHETRDLAKKVVEISGDIDRESRDAHAYQAAVHSEVARSLESMKDLVEDAGQSMQSAVQGIEHIMGLSLKGFEEAGIHSKEVWRQAGEIVLAIQFHDITRQKVEHVVRALNDVASLCASGISGRNDEEDEDDERTRACSLLELQGAQLQGVIENIGTAHKTIQGAFRGIGEAVERFVLTSLNGGNRGVDGEEDPFMILLSTCKDLQGLLERGQNLGNRVCEAASWVSDSLSRLTENVARVRGISMQLHLKVLDAIVKTAPVTEGEGAFEILAQEVRRLSKGADDFVEKLTEVMDRIDVSARKLNIRSSAAEGEAGAEAGEDEQALEEGIQEISRVHARFTEDLSEASRHGRILQEDISQAPVLIRFLPELAQDLAAQLSVVEEMAALLKLGMHDGDKGPLDEMADVSDRYTMNSERDIHERFFQGLAGKELRQEDSKTAEELLDDDFMGVEPFGADSSDVDAPKESAGVESPEFGEDVSEGVEHIDENILEAELSDQETTEQQTVAGSGSAPGETGAEGEEEEDMGSNVELF